MNHRILLAAPLLALLAACATQPQPAPASVADLIARDPNLSTLNGLVVQSGLSDTLRAAGPYTVFAPTNDAFRAVPAKTMADLSHDPAQLKAVLSYHVLPVRLMAAQVKNGPARTTQGASVSMARAGEFVTVEEAVLQTSDIVASNGVVHTVDRVLTPPRH